METKDNRNCQTLGSDENAITPYSPFNNNAIFKPLQNTRKQAKK